MTGNQIRQRFLDFFAERGHRVVKSSSLVPANDPTLLFTNAGMNQFKDVFLGAEKRDYTRAASSQKCVRAGGKHNDLENVGYTRRHHTFFEMLGNFSFGDYFKRDAISFAWEFVTVELAVDPAEIRVSVHHGDDEARALWREVAGLPDARIYGLSDKDNFWQMADTGPCGPCSEIYVDLAHLANDWRYPTGAHGEWTEDREEFSLEAFVEGAEAGRFLEIWNLVFMQYDRQADGTLVPLPKPSVDTGAGLERIAAALQGVTNNYHTDVFSPLIHKVEEVVGVPYWGRESDESRSGLRVNDGRGGSDVIASAISPASFRVLADHARAVAFLLADGVFPSNEGRGYVLRRILRRAVRHAWLLGRKEPTLVHLVHAVGGVMGRIYPDLVQKRTHVESVTRAEEERFFDTIEGGLARLEQLKEAKQISGAEAFKLYDTYGFPIDLTQLIAAERGQTVDVAGFELELAKQRTRSLEARERGKGGKESAAVHVKRGGEWRAVKPRAKH